MENEEEEDDIFTRQGGYEGLENVEKQEEEEEEEEEKLETERKSSLDIPFPTRSLASRRASLPCPAQLNAMHLSCLHAATMTPSPAYLIHRLESGEARPCSRSCHSGNDEERKHAKGGASDRRPPAIPTIPEVHEPLERKARFRSRNVMSLCIEEWLWTKQTCPTCRKHVAMPEPLYWTSTRVIVP
ncbi:uncharacterized protein si:ch211-207l14.1 isoform X2 [Myxocyprinus asiaticus]|uniref:uncharacterized protein si:ch211-207l14.1 isoform X2 n=1 Tax=Myxocyprinus asiaticus TaxID=70543 RepID=UPI0022216018|nr:uncharacterized protein si:ch211-207l14.1 isoform X2 [Myxocyprinus asiaticus]